MERLRLSRRGFVGAAAALMARPAWAQGGRIEMPRLEFGLAIDAASFIPAYVAAARTWAEQGLEAQLTVFRGDAEVSQALAGDSIAVSLQSFDGLIGLVNAGEPAIGFYAGFFQADFAWLSQPSIKDWSDLKGGTVGISTFGSLTEQLTTYALRRHGLAPEKDVQIVQIGPSAAGFQALRSGRLGACILSPPFKWMAADAGLNVLGTETAEIAPQWPKHVFIAKRKFLDDNPGTARALLRAHVAAIRLARAERGFTVKLLVDRLKLTPALAERAYDEMMPGYDEHGGLPEKYMDVFWKIEMQGGEITAPWPDSKLLDDRFIASFSSWAPATPR